MEGRSCGVSLVLEPQMPDTGMESVSGGHHPHFYVRNSSLKIVGGLALLPGASKDQRKEAIVVKRGLQVSPGYLQEPSAA